MTCGRVDVPENGVPVTSDRRYAYACELENDFARRYRLTMIDAACARETGCG
jgi:hypothetical protein